VSAPESPHRPIFLWHPKIHSRIGNEQLVFVLAGFDPVYKRVRVVEEIKRALTDLGIRSYALWELLGDHDLMIQAWLPAGVTTSEFQSKLAEHVSVEAETTPMVVESFIDHWMWRDVDLDEVEASVPSEDYSNLNEGYVPRTRLNNYRHAGYIHATPNSRRLKFFVRITNPHRSTTRNIEAQIRENIKKGFTNPDSSRTGPFVSNGVVMKVHGGASYLITGRLSNSHFTAIGEQFQTAFAESGVLESLGCRTITHLSALYAPVERMEQLLPLPMEDATQRPSDDDLKLWLKESESDDLEFKSSAFTDIDYKVGRKERARNQNEQVHEVAKAVVGLLNAAGGIVVIGVAELDKYPAGELLRAYPGSTQVRDRMIIGVDSEFSKDGWDAYQRRLANALRKTIDGEIDGWVKYHELRIGDKTVCVIRVRRPPTWYYVDSKDKNGVVTNEFFGRMGGETRPLRGQKMDKFKEANPRTTRTSLA
jgi:hypothetical protein